MSNLSIRPAAPADVGLILQFIRELAAYEKLLHVVKASEEDVRRLLFGAAPTAFCEIAELNGAPVGYTLWFYKVSTFEGRRGIHLEDIYVRDEARGAGVGKALMANLARRCLAEGLPRLEWEVLDWNAPSIAFYDRLGATARTELIIRQLSGASLETLARAP